MGHLSLMLKPPVSGLTHCLPGIMYTGFQWPGHSPSLSNAVWLLIWSAFTCFPKRHLEGLWFRWREEKLSSHFWPHTFTQTLSSSFVPADFSQCEQWFLCSREGLDFLSSAPPVPSHPRPTYHLALSSMTHWEIKPGG